MTILQSVQTTSCPHCGCTDVINENIDVDVDYKICVHSHGGRWETRYFNCGFATKYVPNFSCEKSFGECRLTEIYKEKAKMKRAINEQINELYRELKKYE